MVEERSRDIRIELKIEDRECGETWHLTRQIVPKEGVDKVVRSNELLKEISTEVARMMRDTYDDTSHNGVSKDKEIENLKRLCENFNDQITRLEGEQREIKSEIKRYISDLRHNSERRSFACFDTGTAEMVADELETMVENHE